MSCLPPLMLEFWHRRVPIRCLGLRRLLQTAIATMVPRSWKFALVSIACASAGLIPARANAGIDSESNTDGGNPAAEIYSINEAQRQAQIAQQLQLNQQMLWSSGYAPWYPGGVPYLWGYRRNAI